jgi:hypothetical protein
MAAYDPKRPRPSGGGSEEPAPVDALLDPSPGTGSTETVKVDDPAPADSEAIEVDLRDAASHGAPSPEQVVGSDVPVAAAPDEGTANRAVMVAALTAAGLLALVVAVLLLRRRRVD